jgi:hypothetical protein
MYVLRRVSAQDASKDERIDEVLVPQVSVIAQAAAVARKADATHAAVKSFSRIRSLRLNDSTSLADGIRWNTTSLRG